MDLKKQWINIFVVFFILSGPAACLSAATGIPGDVNDDNDVSIVDALMIAHYVAGPQFSGFNADQADVNGDGVVTIVDALIIAQYCVGLIPSLPHITCYNLKAIPEKMISIQPAGSCFSPGITVTLTAPAKYRIIPESGTIIIGGNFYFSHWEDAEGNILSDKTTITVTMDADKLLEAVYTQIW